MAIIAVRGGHHMKLAGLYHSVIMGCSGWPEGGSCTFQYDNNETMQTTSIAVAASPRWSLSGQVMRSQAL